MKRQLEPKLAEYLEGKLAGNGLYADALERKDPRLIFRLAAEACVGIREVGANNAGPLVELIQETLGGADREPWCMGLVQTCLAFAEQKTGVASPICASEHCLTVWNETPAIQRVRTVPDLGAIIIWRHGSSASGHTGITASAVTGRQFSAVEGNTEAGIVGGKVERDGGGVYYTKRSLDGAGTMRLVGFLKPFPPVQPAAPAPASA